MAESPANPVSIALAESCRTTLRTELAQVVTGTACAVTGWRRQIGLSTERELAGERLARQHDLVVGHFAYRRRSSQNVRMQSCPHRLRAGV